MNDLSMGLKNQGVGQCHCLPSCLKRTMDIWCSPHQETTYLMLRRVFQNRVMQRGMSLLEAYTVGMGLVSDLCLQGDRAGVDTGLLIAACLHGLSHRLAMLEKTPQVLPLAPIGEDEDAASAREAVTTPCFASLMTLLAEAAHAHGFHLDGGLIAVGLLADVFHCRKK